MKQRRPSEVHEKKYIVAIPVPYLDRKGRKLTPKAMQKWTHATQRELTKCFGGATPLPSPGTNIVKGRILFEEGQMLVLACCNKRADFLAKRARIRAFVKRMGTALRQHAVLVVAYPSDSFLIELPDDSERQSHEESNSQFRRGRS